MDDLHRALLVLNPSESKRLIAKAVAQMPEVRQAFERGRIIVGNGTTNGYVAEELLGRPVSKWHFAAGVIAGSKLDVTEGSTRLPPLALKQGKPFDGPWVELLREFEAEDVFVKGCNAIDPEGNVGVLLASDVGGTVGQMFGIISARGAHLIVPVGLEKLVPDVIEAASHCGIGRAAVADGIPVGMAVLTATEIVTEIEAFETLFGVDAWHVASGGIAGSEGAVTIAIEGTEEAMRSATQFVASFSEEEAVERD
ncbi:MAG: hypothetical protein ACE149_04220 [Armatimonadota bacterium]